MHIPRSLDAYTDDPMSSLAMLLWHRVVAEPFNLVATGIFLLAIVHTFASGYFRKMAHRRELATPEAQTHSPVTVLLHFLGEIEAVFGLWALPLLLAMGCFFGWEALTHFMDTQAHFTEPVFVIVIMAIASTRPVLSFAERVLGRVASLGGGTPRAWWWTLLGVAPFLGSVITEPAAMTIAASLLGEHFFALKPSNKLKYATLGLLFTNISVGGTLTHFAAPPILMVAQRWNWSSAYVFGHLGAKAIVGIFIATLSTYLFFLKDFKALQAPKNPKTKPAAIPSWVVGAHLGFLTWAVLTLHTLPLMLGGFLFLLAFMQATTPHQEPMNLRSPLMVGFFLAGLVVHGSLQEWWIAPLLSRLGELPLFGGAAVLTAFNDNAAITYLASLVPDFLHNSALQHAVVSGAVVAGGMTVIANAPNPAGQAILNRHFGPQGVSPLGLFIGATGPTLIMVLAFRFL